VTRERLPKLPNWALGLIFAVAAVVLGLAVVDAAVTRDPQNDLPDWAIGLIFVVGTLLLALSGFALVNRLLPAWRDERSNQVIGGVAAMVMTMFAVLVAFVIVNLYNSYNGAVDNVAAEATSLTELLEDTDSFPPAARSRVERAIAEYVEEVRTREFNTLHHGRADPRAQQLLANIHAAVQSFSPVTTAQQTFYSSANELLHMVVSERESRLDAAETAIPKPLLYLMILLAVLTLAMTVLIVTHLKGVDLAIVVTVAVVISSGLFTAEILQYPFSGTIAVSSDPFNGPVLSQLVKKYT
jgi:cytochrome bd-type quinol oxidase subunit 2